MLIHIKNQNSYLNKSGPSGLILTPFQPSKDDIYAKTKEYIEAAEVKCVLVYESEDKNEQIEKLKSRKFLVKIFI